VIVREGVGAVRIDRREHFAQSIVSEGLRIRERAGVVVPFLGQLVAVGIVREVVAPTVVVGLGCEFADRVVSEGAAGAAWRSSIDKIQ
jgi:hypothetical protein